MSNTVSVTNASRIGLLNHATLDIIIVEDDPYFFLQQGEYVPKAARADSADAISEEAWISTLAPSFLKFDYEGRVIRLDTFSKVKTTYKQFRIVAHLRASSVHCTRLTSRMAHMQPTVRGEVGKARRDVRTGALRF